MTMHSSGGATADDSAPPRRRNLKQRLIWQISAVVAASLLLVTSIVITLMARHIEHARQETMRETSYHELRRIEQRIAYLLETVDRLADTPLVANSLSDPQGRRADLPKLIATFKANRDAIGVALVDTAGTPVFATGDAAPSFSDYPQLRQAMTAHRHTVILSSLKNSIIVFSPIEQDNTAQGAAIATFDIKSLEKPAQSDETLYAEQLYYTDDQGKRRTVFSQMSHSPGNYIVVSARPDDSTPYLQELNIALDIGVLREPYYAPVRDTIINFILLSILATAVATLAAARIGNSIAHPILDLCGKISQLDSADRTTRCSPVGTNDELEDLACAFDQRTAELWAIQDELERRVEERTHELKAANESLKFLTFALDEHAIVSATDVTGRITYVNDKFCSISGYSREDLLGQNHRLIRSQEHSEAFYRTMWRGIAQGQVWHGEIKNAKRNGGYYTISA